jgi:5'(3')-deoxyribonucleotidase|tara:strand:- start:791 stop:1246 length:456 start_codon:yes stop_codon:yes gene_type:complete
MNTKKKIVYFDMDGVLVNFQSGIDQLDLYHKIEYREKYDEVPGIFGTMKPNEDMIDLFNAMFSDERYDCYVLSTAPWENPSASSDKVEWIQKYLPKAYKRLILSHNKHLNVGDYLIDDRTANGAGEFGGELLQYGVTHTIEDLKELFLNNN